MAIIQVNINEESATPFKIHMDEEQIQDVIDELVSVDLIHCTNLKYILKSLKSNLKLFRGEQTS